MIVTIAVLLASLITVLVLARLDQAWNELEEYLVAPPEDAEALVEPAPARAGRLADGFRPGPGRRARPARAPAGGGGTGIAL